MCHRRELKINMSREMKPKLWQAKTDQPYVDISPDARKVLQARARWINQSPVPCPVSTECIYLTALYAFRGLERPDEKQPLFRNSPHQTHTSRVLLVPRTIQTGGPLA
jgi:hypothetical protein